MVALNDMIYNLWSRSWHLAGCNLYLITKRKGEWGFEGTGGTGFWGQSLVGGGVLRVGRVATWVSHGRSRRVFVLSS